MNDFFEGDSLFLVDSSNVDKIADSCKDEDYSYLESIPYEDEEDDKILSLQIFDSL